MVGEMPPATTGRTLPTLLVRHTSTRDMLFLGRVRLWMESQTISETLGFSNSMSGTTDNSTTKAQVSRNPDLTFTQLTNAPDPTSTFALTARTPPAHPELSPQQHPRRLDPIPPIHVITVPHHPSKPPPQTVPSKLPFHCIKNLLLPTYHLMSISRLASPPTTQVTRRSRRIIYD
jgi:hypothetical protein